MDYHEFSGYPRHEIEHKKTRKILINVFDKTGANTVVVDRLIHKASAYYRDAGSRGAGGVHAHLDFGRSVNPISTKGQIMFPIL